MRTGVVWGALARVVICTCVVRAITCTVIEYSLAPNTACPKQVSKIHRNTTYLLVWDGSVAQGNKSCVFEFQPNVTDVHNFAEIQVCAKSVQFSVNKCDVNMVFKRNKRPHKKVFGCQDTSFYVCSRGGNSLISWLEAASVSKNSSIVVNVTVHVSHDADDIWIIMSRDSIQEGVVGVAIGACVGLFIVSLCILIKCLRHRRSDFPNSNGSVCEKPSKKSFIFKGSNSNSSHVSSTYVPVTQNSQC